MLEVEKATEWHHKKYVDTFESSAMASSWLCGSARNAVSVWITKALPQACIPSKAECSALVNSPDPSLSRRLRARVRPEIRSDLSVNHLGFPFSEGGAFGGVSRSSRFKIFY